MDIVDSQVHLNRFGSHWRNTAPDVIVDYAVAAMDALGIDGIVIDEWAGFDAQHRHLPGAVLPNGAMRGQYPFSQRAVALHPDRFAYVARIDPNDPEIDALVDQIHEIPGVVALSIDLPETREARVFQGGGYDRMLSCAEAHRVPIVAWVPGRAELLERPLDAFPNLRVVLSHCGLSRADRDHLATFNRVLELARYPNVAIKWCHVPTYLSHEPYPFRDVLPHLRRAIDAFGPQRIMWASDHTESRVHHSWAQALYYILDSQLLTDGEKEWIVGRSARTMLDWPRPSLEGASRDGWRLE
jgi:predicted TIM-barrel fold metal-dependent hydrolase